MSLWNEPRCPELILPMFPCRVRNDRSGVADIFLKKGPFLKMYSSYICEFDKNVALLEEQCKKNPAFAKVVREFEVRTPTRPVLPLSAHVDSPVRVCASSFYPVFTVCVVLSYWMKAAACCFNPDSITHSTQSYPVSFCNTEQSMLCQPGGETLHAEACAEDPPVPAAPHRSVWALQGFPATGPKILSTICTKNRHLSSVMCVL